MGQKVNPISLRLGVNKDWQSKWFSDNKNFSKYLNNDIKIRKYLAKKLKEAAVASIIIERNNEGRCDVTINTAKRGIIIGKGGEDIEKLRKELKRLVGEDIYVSIVEVKNPDLNAQIVAEGAGSPGVREMLYRFRNYLESTLDKTLDYQDSAVMKAILLGDKTYMDEEIKDLYKNSGIIHILAVSGV